MKKSDADGFTKSPSKHHFISQMPVVSISLDTLYALTKIDPI
jgi:hypothetical protein